MKAVILAGGLGTRLGRETEAVPKPMVAIGGRPILWHIMKSYSSYGVNDFVVCLGYKGHVIKEYFAAYALQTSDVSFDLKKGEVIYHRRRCEDWRVTLVDTGEETQTGGRLKRVRDHLDKDSFCFTYGDGVSNVPIDKLIAFHKKHKKTATVTAVRPPARWGMLKMDGDLVTGFEEKVQGSEPWINGGYFVLEPKALDFIESDETIWEQEPLKKLTAAGELAAYHHESFWQCMDNPREKRLLETLWQEGQAPWKVWTD